MKTDKEKTKQMLIGSVSSYIFVITGRNFNFLCSAFSSKEAKVLRAELCKAKLLVFLQFTYPAL